MKIDIISRLLLEKAVKLGLLQFTYTLARPIKMCQAINDEMKPAGS